MLDKNIIIIETWLKSKLKSKGLDAAFKETIEILLLDLKLEAIRNRFKEELNMK